MKKGKLTDRIKEYIEQHPYDLDAAAGLAAAYSHIHNPAFYDEAKWTEVKLRSALNGNDEALAFCKRFIYYTDPDLDEVEDLEPVEHIYGYGF